MKKKSSFSTLFKLSSGKIALAFTTAEKLAGTYGIKILYTSAKSSSFIIAISRTLKGSVRRNKVRRRIKAALQVGIRTYGPLGPGIYLCVVYPSTETRSFQELSHWLITALWKNKEKTEH